MKIHRILFSVLSIGLVCGGMVLTRQAHTASKSKAVKAPTTMPTAAQKLKKLFAEEWINGLKENPIGATYTGYKGLNHKLPSMTLQDIHRRAKTWRFFLKRLAAIPKVQLSQQDRINAALFRQKLLDALTEYKYKMYLLPITNREGFHISFTRLPSYTPLRSAKDYQDFIARMKAFKKYTQQHITLMKMGLKQGYTIPRVTLKGYEGTISPHIVKDPEKSVFYAPFKRLPKRFSAKLREQLQKQAKEVILSSVVPAFRSFFTFMTKTYIPGSRKTIAASALPNGKAYYAHRVKLFTTQAITPKQVHQIGLSEVKRIRKEMKQVIKQVKFKGSFKDFLKHLRTHPKFYAKTPAQLLKEVSYVLKQMDGQLPKLFGKLPRTPYGIKKIPDYIAPKTTTAFYSPLSGDGRKAGFYYVNTYNLKSRPLYEIEALSFHEAVPGHHLQIALQREQRGLPKFRNYLSVTAFVEGWALYAERLGLEVGFYKDPYSNFGRLTYEMWRACRLAIDTGIHAFGWSRDKAIKFMANNTALSLHNVTTEIDRYIAWPGQALGYKMGELKIRELRQKAQKALGSKFDLRAFHDAILKNGAIPMYLLEKEVTRFIKKHSKTKK